jgi:hypothetical protein
VSSATITSTNANAAGGNTLTVNASPTNAANAFLVTDTALVQNVIVGLTADATGAYNYMTLGMWGDCATNCGVANETGVIGYYVYGQETPAGAIPASGTANYTGATSGNYMDAAGQLFGVTSTVAVSADFLNRSLAMSTASSSVMDGNGVSTAKPDLNIRMSTLTYGSNSNTFSGNVSDEGNRSGTATGRFFGPAAQEIGGVYYVKGTDGSTNIGSFVGKQ